MCICDYRIAQNPLAVSGVCRDSPTQWDLLPREVNGVFSNGCGAQAEPAIRTGERSKFYNSGEVVGFEPTTSASRTPYTRVPAIVKTM
jgi:hypothetical protein